jgi:hypothetical protein
MVLNAKMTLCLIGINALVACAIPGVVRNEGRDDIVVARRGLITRHEAAIVPDGSVGYAAVNLTSPRNAKTRRQSVTWNGKVVSLEEAGPEGVQHENDLVEPNTYKGRLARIERMGDTGHGAQSVSHASDSLVESRFIGHLVGGIVGGVGHLVGGIVGGVGTVVGGVFKGVRHLLGGVGKLVFGIAETVAHTVKYVLKGAAMIVGEVLGGVYFIVETALEGVGLVLKGVGKAVKGIAEGIGAILVGVGKLVVGVLEQVGEIAKDAVYIAAEVVEASIAIAANIAGAAVKGSAKLLEFIATTVKNKVVDAALLGGEAAEFLVGGKVESITAVIEGVFKLVKKVIKDIKPGKRSVLEEVSEESCIQSACLENGTTDNDCCSKPDRASCREGFDMHLDAPRNGCPAKTWWRDSGLKTVCCVDASLTITEAQKEIMDMALARGSEDMLPAMARSFTAFENGDPTQAAAELCAGVRGTLDKMVVDQQDVTDKDKQKVIENADAVMAFVSGVSMSYRNKLFESQVCQRDENPCPSDKPHVSSQMTLGSTDGVFCGSGVDVFSKLAEAMEAARRARIGMQEGSLLQAGRKTDCESSLPQTMDRYSRDIDDVADFQIPACSSDPSVTDPVPAECSNYMHETGCDWTSKYSCPGQEMGESGQAGDDGSVGYQCCCGKGLSKFTVTGTWSSSTKGVSIRADEKTLHSGGMEYTLSNLKGDSFSISDGFNGGSATYNGTAIRWANGDVYRRGVHVSV